MASLEAAPFSFPVQYRRARDLARSGFRTFTSTSAGRLFDAAAALLGFTQPIEYEGQAAVWLEQLAWRSGPRDPLPFTIADRYLDLRPALHALVSGRLAGSDGPSLARAFHETLAAGMAAVACRLCATHDTDIVVLSGGTFQNALLGERLRARLPASLQIWTNHRVPMNDGGISLGQAAIAAALSAAGS